jgi:integrase
MRPLCEKAAVPRIRFHDFRHLSASYLLLAGVHIKVVSERLGHSNIKITLETYSHVLPTTQDVAVTHMAGLLDRTLPDTCTEPVEDQKDQKVCLDYEPEVGAP